MELTTKEQAIIDQAEYEYKQSVKKRKSEYTLFTIKTVNKKGNNNNVK